VVLHEVRLEWVVVVVLNLDDFGRAMVVTIRWDLGSFEQAMVKLNASSFEWVTTGLGELGTGVTAAGPKSDGGA
jgi:hypothetical protein